ncbi:MAG TPA: carboxypeptidase-like regulatory domain-containing protein, partial [Phnomibacter sp.]|nr:carboxypeptidase-like regulatory domain-containing protein [Phnomibacter sp.]
MKTKEVRSPLRGGQHLVPFGHFRPMRNIFLSILLVLITGGLAFGQSIPVSGKVSDEQGAPIIGASISIKGTRAGTVTDNSGNFTLNVEPGKTIIISMVGFSSREV